MILDLPIARATALQIMPHLAIRPWHRLSLIRESAGCGGGDFISMTAVLVTGSTMAFQSGAMRNTKLHPVPSRPLNACLQANQTASMKAGMFLWQRQCRGDDELPAGSLSRSKEAVRLGSAPRKHSPSLGCRQGAEEASQEAGKASVEAAAAEVGATASQATAMRTTRHPCEHPANLWTASQQVPLSPPASLEKTHIHGLHKCTSQGCMTCWRLPCSVVRSCQADNGTQGSCTGADQM